ncbi:transposase [Rhodovulum sulfidophilum]|uniref:Transposase n=1 Tax=Rhodovulum sulfidophilum TaxID=35806 RepID=A0A0D6B7R4_RHOSU|nr:transposase [Rhodovulum sulfidophilum]
MASAVWEPTDLRNRSGFRRRPTGLVKAVSGLTLDEPILTEAARGVKDVSGKVRGPFPP